MHSKVSHDSETAAHGQQVITACAFIYTQTTGKTKVFLPRRAKTKKFLPDVFELPGGHIDFGENLKDGLAREVREEFGVGIALYDPFAAFTYMNTVKGSHSVEVVFFAEFTDPLEHITCHPEDHSGFEWFTEEDVVARRDEIEAPEYADLEAGGDPEYLAILKGFELLEPYVTRTTNKTCLSCE